METGTGFEKTESGLRYQFIQRGKVKKQKRKNSGCSL
jgi:hypothetical protein